MSEGISKDAKKQELLEKYQVGKTVTFGNYKGKPLEWKVVDTNGNMRRLLAVQAVDFRPFDDDLMNTSWQKCSLRNWLNQKFIREAFSVKEMVQIIGHNRDNKPNENYYTVSGPVTKDKISVLSFEEVKKYLPEESDRRKGCWWWLRTLGANFLSAACVYRDGSIYESGINITYPDGGVIPDLWILLRL